MHPSMLISCPNLEQTQKHVNILARAIYACACPFVCRVTDVVRLCTLDQEAILIDPLGPREYLFAPNEKVVCVGKFL